MDIIQCHLRSLPIHLRTIPLLLHLLPNIHILELHERVCLKIDVWNPLLFYVYSLSHRKYNYTCEHPQTSATSQWQ
jgi:hypothetical protein